MMQPENVNPIMRCYQRFNCTKRMPSFRVLPHFHLERCPPGIIRTIRTNTLVPGMDGEAYIGLRRNHSYPAGFYWLDGSPFSNTSYSNWGQPAGTNDCVSMVGQSMAVWKAHTCDKLVKGVVCKQVRASNTFNGNTFFTGPGIMKLEG